MLLLPRAEDVFGVQQPRREPRALLCRPGPTAHRGGHLRIRRCRSLTKPTPLEDGRGRPPSGSALAGRGGVTSSVSSSRRAPKRASSATPGTATRWRSSNATRQAAERFFLSVYQWQMNQPKGSGPGSSGGNQQGARKETSSRTRSAPTSVARRHAPRTREGARCRREKVELTSRGDRLYAMAKSVKEWLGQALAGQVYLCRGEARARAARLTRHAPIEVGPGAEGAALRQGCRAWCLASATLSVGGEAGSNCSRSAWGSTARRRRSSGARSISRSRRSAHLPEHAGPSAQSAKYEEEVLKKIPDTWPARRAVRSCCLTSYGFLNRAAQQLMPWFVPNGYNAPRAGHRLPAPKLLELVPRLQEGGAVRRGQLLAGLDGARRSALERHHHEAPVFGARPAATEARLEAIQADGGNPFMEFSGAASAIKLKQGFGRLIRNGHRHGYRGAVRPAGADEALRAGVPRRTARREAVHRRGGGQPAPAKAAPSASPRLT